MDGSEWLVAHGGTDEGLMDAGLTDRGVVGGGDCCYRVGAFMHQRWCSRVSGLAGGKG